MDSSGGRRGCPCLSESALPPRWLAQWQPNETCRLIRGRYLSGNPDELDYCYPRSYGVGDCVAHDEFQPPFCADMQGRALYDAPGWCSYPWCYVDNLQCDEGRVDDLTPSAFVLEEGSFDEVPHYSFQTCGLDLYTAKFRRAVLRNATEILNIVSVYVRELREFLEGITGQVQEDIDEGGACEFEDGCNCLGCMEASGQWVERPAGAGPNPYMIDHTQVTVSHRSNASSGEDERFSQCFASQAQTKFQEIARLEYDDPDRLGWLFFGDQRSAVWFGWPGVGFCPNDETEVYDPRFQPWYVNAVSGPKDVIIVLDNSGSMTRHNRRQLSANAALTVLKTLTEFDYAALVIFGSTARSFNDQTVMLPATANNVAAMEGWLLAIETLDTMGSTSFVAAFRKAFEIVGASRTAGTVSNCNSMLLFLTDGSDTSGLRREDLSEMNPDGQNKWTIFTYSFGGDAEAPCTVGYCISPKEIACHSHGIWHRIPDGGSIDTVMANYFYYYAEALSESKQVRWATYRERKTGRDLISSCSPVYDRRSPPVQLLGVVCMDVSLIESIDVFQARPDFLEAGNRMHEDGERCMRVEHNPRTLEHLRSLHRECSRCDTPCAADVNAAFQSNVFCPKLLVAVLLATSPVRRLRTR